MRVNWCRQQESDQKDEQKSKTLRNEHFFSLHVSGFVALHKLKRFEQNHLASHSGTLNLVSRRNGLSLFFHHFVIL